MYLQRKLLLIIIFLYTFTIHAMTLSDSIVVKGIVKDKITNKAIAGAVVTLREFGNLQGKTNTDGLYQLKVNKAGTYTFICKALGYLEEQQQKEIPATTSYDFLLNPVSNSLKEAVVVGGRINIFESPQMGLAQLSVKEMLKIPAFMGEQDVLKAMQSMPGVKIENDGSSGFQVRGGESTQNLILLDGTSVNHAGHLLGIFPAFNAEALRTATLFKGQVPAEYGGRIASVMKLETKAGNVKKYSGSAKLGLLSAAFHLNGPIKKESSSFSLSLRRTYADLFFKMMPKLKNNVMNFHDVHLKFLQRLSEKDVLLASLFWGRDNIGINNFADMKWDNQAASFTWEHRFDFRWSLKTNLNYSSYQSNNALEILLTRYAYDSAIREFGAQTNLSFRPNRHTEFSWGLSSRLYDAVSADWDVFYVQEKERRRGLEHNLWFQSDYNLTQRLKLSTGLRLSVYAALGGSKYYTLSPQQEILETTTPSRWELYKTYWNAEPRLGLSYTMSKKHILKASYNRMTQNIHTLKNPVTTAPFERYILTSNLLKPQIADQLSVGYNGGDVSKMYEWKLEGYYKWMRHQLDYLDGKGFFTAVELETLLTSGKGRAYGLECSVQKKRGQWQGWLGYTLSWSQRKMEEINRGEWYTANNDRRHEVNAVVMYHLNKRWHFSANFVFLSGQALNAPSAKYEVDGQTNYYYGSRNAYRTPAYHRLDLSATYSYPLKNKRYQGEWNFALFNAYGRYNPYVVEITSDKDKPSGTSVKQTSLYGLIPSISYKISF